MFSFSRPNDAAIQRALTVARAAPWFGQSPPSCDASAMQNVPPGFAHDVSDSTVGSGERDFANAREALSHWRQFDLGWVGVVNPKPRLETNALVGIWARTGPLWSLNWSGVVETTDDPTQFGFTYATTVLHVEEGVERFVVTLDPQTGDVRYHIDAISRPRHPLARLGYPYARAVQHRFVRGSHAKLHEILERQR